MLCTVVNLTHSSGKLIKTHKLWAAFEKFYSFSAPAYWKLSTAGLQQQQRINSFLTLFHYVICMFSPVQKFRIIFDFPRFWNIIVFFTRNERVESLSGILHNPPGNYFRFQVKLLRVF